MQHPSQHWPQSAPPPGGAGGLPGPPHHPQYSHHGGPPPPPPPPQQGWGHHPQAPHPPHSAHQGGGSQPPPSGAPPSGIFRERSISGKPQDGGVGASTNGYPPPQGYEGHPPSHGYSHGPPQGYGYTAQGSQQAPLGYYGSQHPPPPHHAHPGQQGPLPPNHSQWGHHPTYGGAHPPGPSSHPGSSHHPHSSNGSSALWEHQQHSSQSRQQENSLSSEGYFPSHPPPSSGFSRQGPPPPGGAPPHSSGGRASYNPSRGGAPPPPTQSQHPHGISSHNSGPPSQTAELSNMRKAPPPSASSTPGMPPPHHGSSIPPHHPHGPPPPVTSQPTPPSGYPSNKYRGPPPPCNPQNLSIHPSYSTASTRTSNTAATSLPGPTCTLALHNTPGALSTSTTYTDDEKGRGSYKCGRCGVPKKGHVCPYQPKVKRRPEDQMPEMKCVSTQVEMDEFMTLRRLNIEIQGYPESYAAEPLDMVGTEVGQYPPPQPPLSHAIAPGHPGSLNTTHGSIIESQHPTHMPSEISSGDHGVAAPPSSGPHHSHHGVSPPFSQEGPFLLAMSSSHDAVPQTALPAVSSIPSQPASAINLPPPLQEASSLSSSQNASPDPEASPGLLAAQSLEPPFPHDTTGLEVCEAPGLSESTTIQTNTEDVSATALCHLGEVKSESTLSTINREALDSAATTTGQTDDKLHLRKEAEPSEDNAKGEFCANKCEDPSNEEAYVEEFSLITGKQLCNICEDKSSPSSSKKLETTPFNCEKGGLEASVAPLDECPKWDARESTSEVSSTQEDGLSNKKRRT